MQASYLVICITQHWVSKKKTQRLGEFVWFIIENGEIKKLEEN